MGFRIGRSVKAFREKNRSAKRRPERPGEHCNASALGELHRQRAPERHVNGIVDAAHRNGALALAVHDGELRPAAGEHRIRGNSHAVGAPRAAVLIRMTGINERIKIRGFRGRARAKTAGEARSHDVEAPGMPKSVRREDAKPLSRACSPRIRLALGRKREAEIDRRFAVCVGIPSVIKKPDACPHRTRRERFVVIPAKVLIPNK